MAAMEQRTIETVTDLVMQRQLIEVPRDHAKGIVTMVLECADQATGPAEPTYKPRSHRRNVTIKKVTTLELGHGFCDHVRYAFGWASGPGQEASAYGPPRNDAAPTAMTMELLGAVGHNVALWVTDDEFVAMPTIIQFNDLGPSQG